jgi:hypothetical protein
VRISTCQIFDPPLPIFLDLNPRSRIVPYFVL